MSDTTQGDEPPHRPDWYPDPSARYEYRFHNGQSWTADVSRGGYRAVDPLGTEPPAQRPHHDGGATAALVLGIVGVTLAWMPFLVAPGVICAVLAIVLGVVANRRPNRDTRGFAAVGVVTGIGALGLATLGVWFTGRVIDAIDEFNDPPEYTVQLTKCDVDPEVTPMQLRVAGTITNVDTRAGDFRILVDVDDMTSGHQRRLVFTIDSLVPRQPYMFERSVMPGPSTHPAETSVSGTGSGSADSGAPECFITDVTGGLPFGIDIDVK